MPPVPPFMRPGANPALSHPAFFTTRRTIITAPPVVALEGTGQTGSSGTATLTVSIESAAGAAAVVVPPWVPIDAEGLREALADAVRESVREAMKAADQRRRWIDGLTIIGFPLTVGSSCYTLYVAFKDDPQIAVSIVAVMIVAVILMNYVCNQRRRP